MHLKELKAEDSAYTHGGEETQNRNSAKNFAFYTGYNKNVHSQSKLAL